MHPRRAFPPGLQVTVEDGIIGAVDGGRPRTAAIPKQQ